MGGGAKYPHKFEVAILMLLQESTVQRAAQKAGVSDATLSRWMAHPIFREKYQAARRKSFEAGLSRLQSLCGGAVDSLKKNLTCGRPSVEVRCAEAILSHAREAGGYLDLAEWLTKLERGLNEKEAE